MSNLGKIILIVEDDEMMREWLALHLGEKGYKITLAANARELKEPFSDSEIDLVLLDLGLPDAEAIEIA